MSRLPREWRPELHGSLLLGTGLGLAALLRPVLRLARIDPVALRILLEARLTLSLKGGAAAGKQRGGSLGPVLALLLFWLAGLGGGVTGLLGTPMTFMLTTGAVLMGLLGFILLLQVSDLLVDPTDVEVLGPLPIEGRTLLAARLVHAWLFVVVLSLTYSFFPVVLGSIGLRAWQPLLVVPLATLLAGLTTLGLVVLGHALLLRLLGPAHFQRVAFWAQVFGVAAMIAVTQVGPRLVPVGVVIEAFEARPDWLVWLPPAHLGGLLEVALGEPQEGSYLLAALALLVPVALTVVALLLCSRHYLEGLRGELSATEGPSGGWPSGAGAGLVRRLPLSHEARAGFGQAWALSLRDRFFSRAVVPYLVSIGLPAASLAIGFGSLPGRTRELPVLLGPYILGILGTGMADLMRLSEWGEASWLHRVLPGGGSGGHLRGVLTAVHLRLTLPFLLAIALGQLVWLGPGSAPDVLLGFGVCLAMNLHFGRSAEYAVPFTHKPVVGELQTRNLSVLLPCMMACSLAALAHAGLWFLAPGWVRGLAALGVLLVLPRLLRRASGLEPLELEAA